ncbi:MAG TPA: RNA 2',3'-cyclic phosphodiesterase [Candidatus Omnitrophota bacterium]|nr:RNA 2',3'-cyclic phosphodiesterase [Candidatus Omnitrophota bacterium]HQO38271.1 RNA 2',3'-cyclic phosphodiesterase [Candidatus Omnitrophota bacterium]HQQ06291.1 RNA 2',3'-cyclic phosphodiesterase [Candidatus Omnitrophota bacterium]
MRTFIAITLPPDVKDAVGRLQNKLKTSGADVKWVSPANIHLTLKFLGDIDEITKNSVSEALRLIAANSSDFTIRLGSIGAFPSIRSPRIIWIGLAEGHAQARSIVDQIETGLEDIGIPKEARPFSSHITIARVRSKKNIDLLIDGIAGLDKTLTVSGEFKAGGFKAGKLTFFKSTLTPQGPVYEILQETDLKTI